MVVASVLAADAEGVLEALAAVPPRCGLVELRADRLRAGDVEGLVRRIERPTLVAVRDAADGGTFDGSVEERRAILLAALDAGARFVDVEDGGPLADLAEGPHASRVLLSHHGLPCDPAALAARYARMKDSRAAALKIVPRASCPGDGVAVRDLLERAHRDGKRLAAFAMGRAGLATRILACSWGSWATYGALAAGRETAEGQPTADDLLETYRVLDIRAGTRRFALVGRSIAGSPSPAMHRAGYVEHGIDATYLPLECERLEDALPLVGRRGCAGIEGLAVTMPFKVEAAERSKPHDPVAEHAGAVNTVRIHDARWDGFNTDGPAAVERVRAHCEPRGARVAIAGAGGTARGLAAAFVLEHARVALYARDATRARAETAHLGVPCHDFDRITRDEWDVLINATPLGTAGERWFPPERLRGRLVLDAVYGRDPTPLVADARGRGRVGIDGLELLVAQAVRQFRIFTGRPGAAGPFRAAALRWLEARP